MDGFLAHDLWKIFMILQLGSSFRIYFIIHVLCCDFFKFRFYLDKIDFKKKKLDI